MNIEIVTTKKKINKRIVSQMRHANKTVMSKGKVMGYITNAIKDSYMIALIHYDNDYWYLPLTWKKGQKNVYRGVGKRYTSSIKFENEQNCNEWWKLYIELGHEAMKTHIYL